MSFAATWMDIEIIILSKSYREKQILYAITYMWNLKYGTNELIYKTDLQLPKGRGVGEGQSGSLGLADANYFI